MINRRKFLSIGLIGLSSVALFSRSLTGYYDDKKYGIIDTTGTWIIKPKFGWISDSVKGLCTALLSRDDDSLCGIVDLSGRWVIEPGTFKATNTGKMERVRPIKSSEKMV